MLVLGSSIILRHGTALGSSAALTLLPPPPDAAADAVAAMRLCSQVLTQAISKSSTAPMYSASAVTLVLPPCWGRACCVDCCDDVEAAWRWSSCSQEEQAGTQQVGHCRSRCSTSGV